MNSSIIGVGKVVVEFAAVMDKPNINANIVGIVGKNYSFKVIFQSCPMSLSKNNSINDLWFQTSDHRWIPMKIGNKQYCSFIPYKTIFIKDIGEEPISIMDENNNHYILYPNDLVKE
jgi:hypothetical protein